MSAPFSFKIGAPSGPSSASSQRPPPSRAPGSGSRAYHHPHPDEEDSSDDDAFAQRHRDEEITAFGAGGATSKAKAKKEAPLAIPSLANKDWRAEASKNRRPKRGMYIPDAVGSMRVGGPAPGAAGADGSQGGLGTRDVINDAAVVGGLAMPSARAARVGPEEVIAMETDAPPSPPPAAAPTAPETDEQRALRELLAGGPDAALTPSAPLAAIHSAHDTFQSGPQDETSAFRSDVQTRPDEPDLDAYARVPVGQFGAALLRGMGWKEGTAASRTGRTGPTEAYVPKSRPAMLGIGAKPLADVLGAEKDRNGKPVRRDRAGELRFVPLVKRAREGGPSGSSTPVGALTNGSSPALGSSRSESGRRDEGKTRSDRDRDSHRSGDRDRDSSHRPRSHRERSRSPRRDDRDRDRHRSDRDRDLGRSSRREDDERRSSGRGERDGRDRRDDGRDRRDEGRDRRDRDRDYRDRDIKEDRREGPRDERRRE